MNKLILSLLCLLFMEQTLIAGDSDTSYSEVRVKKRTPESNSSDSDDDESSCTSDCMGSCISFLLDGCFSLVCNNDNRVGVTITDANDDQKTSPPAPQTSHKQITYPWQSSTPVHFSGGLVIGGETYSDSIADAFDIGAELGVTFYPLQFLGIRLSSELLAGIGGMNVDLEIDRTIDDTVETLTFTDTELFNRIVPIKAELLWIISTNDNTPLFLSTGGGITYKQEKVSGKEISDDGSKKRTVTFDQWSPTLHFGVGFFSQLGKLFFIPEFRYSLIFNDDKHDYLAPGDVASYTHMFRVCVSICNP